MSEGSSAEDAATVSAVAEAMSRGARIKARRERMGISAREFAERSGLHRATLEKIESDHPKVRPTSYAIAENALNDIADEMGHARDDTGLLRVEIQPDGAIVVQSPVENVEELVEMVAAVLARLRDEGR